jgi:small subunit ribosomal protein S20
LKEKIFYKLSRQICSRSLNYRFKYFKDMANSKQSIKRARQNADRYKLKHSQRSQARTAVKAVRNAIAENNKESATELLKTAQKVLDSTAAKKVIHKNAAARTKSRLVKAVKELS